MSRVDTVLGLLRKTRTLWGETESRDICICSKCLLTVSFLLSRHLEFWLMSGWCLADVSRRKVLTRNWPWSHIKICVCFPTIPGSYSHQSRAVSQHAGRVFKILIGYVLIDRETSELHRDCRLTIMYDIKYEGVQYTQGRQSISHYQCEHWPSSRVKPLVSEPHHPSQPL